MGLITGPTRAHTGNLDIAGEFEWHYADGPSVDRDGVQPDAGGVEAKWRLSDPIVDPIGVAMFGEAEIGDRVAAVQGRLIVQKDIGSWTFAWNGAIESTWEGFDYQEAAATLSQSLRVWCRVAMLSFGGPAGQIAVMHRILVEEKRWISENRFLHALNYCMLLPGPEA